ncbi:MAG: NAD(P)/FAD-dependent oxidoreductase, partial [Desulfuromonadaceae bacterium]
MSLRLREIPLHLDEEESALPVKLAEILGLSVARIRSWRIVRRGIDARKKPRVLRMYTVEFSLDDEAEVLRRHAGSSRLEPVVSTPLPELARKVRPQRVLVVGMGPAGLFAALRLAQHGLQVTLLERGKPVEERIRDVERFWHRGLLDPSSNVQFGEGGAGTFSDGKLTTRLNSPWIRLVLQTLVDFGAPEEILVQAKPHVGSDRLRHMLVNFRRGLQNLGVDIRFNTCLTGLETRGGRVVAGLLADGSRFDCEQLVLALGHSARDTYRMLLEAGVLLEPKPFAVGVRVEHAAEWINRIQYGLLFHPRLPTAEYALSWNDPESKRGVYSFCM